MILTYFIVWSYMDYVLHERIMGTDEETDSIIKDSTILDEMSFEDYVLSLISPHIGKTDKELCTMLDLEYTGNKAQWTKITYALLGPLSFIPCEIGRAHV